jgi:hypothetical protein
MADEEQDNDEQKVDRFGLKHMTTNQEVAVSFTLFTAGMLLILATFVPLIHIVDLGPGFLGTIMVATAYLFMTESVRELEEKDHFLAKKLRKNKD